MKVKMEFKILITAAHSDASPMEMVMCVPLAAHRQSVQAQGAAAAADGCQAAENHRDDERGGGEAAERERLCEYIFCAHSLFIVTSNSSSN